MKATDHLLNKEVYINENLDDMVEIFAKMENQKLVPVINCLKMYKDQKGTKLQIKFVNGCAEIICKWGGILTHTGAIQCHELADNLNYYISDHNADIFNKMKIYSSSEGRVFESALEFTKSFGNRVFGVQKDKELLDETFHATELIEAGRKRLLIEFEKFKTAEDEAYFLKTFQNIRLLTNINQVHNDHGVQKNIEEDVGFDEHSKNYLRHNEDYINDVPNEISDSVGRNYLIKNEPMTNVIAITGLTVTGELVTVYKRESDNEENDTNKPDESELFNANAINESNEIDERWYKIQSKVLSEPKMSYNKISEINDNLKYDLIHNNERIKAIFGPEKIVEFYLFVRKYYRFLIENEYGMTQTEKLNTSKAISGNLLQKIVESLQGIGADIFFTKESRMYTLFNLISHLSKKPIMSKEFNYASYIGFDLYERNGVMRVSIVFSRGFNCQEIVDGCLDSRHRAPLKDEEILCDISLDEFHKSCESILKE